jgi:hypothetical protein
MGVCSARKGVLKVDLAKTQASSKVAKRGRQSAAIKQPSGETMEEDDDYNRQLAVLPRKAANKRSNRKYDAALAAQLFGLKEDTPFHKRKTVDQAPGGGKGKKQSPYLNIKGPKPLIVLDAPNIAMRFGKGRQFRSAALNVVIVYYQRRGHKVVAFLPESYLDAERISGLRRAEKVSAALSLPGLPSRKHPNPCPRAVSVLQLGHETNVAKLPDDVPALQSLVDKGLLHLTPNHVRGLSTCRCTTCPSCFAVVCSAFGLRRTTMTRTPSCMRNGMMGALSRTIATATTWINCRL